MSEISPTSNQLSASFDPLEIEARLNALVGNCGDAGEVHQEEEPDLLQQFLADDSLEYLETRSTFETEQGKQHSIVQLYRIVVLPNQSRLVIHPAFRPDLSEAPSIEATCIDREARIRVTRSTVFGARLEINLTSAEATSSQCCLEVICTATAKPPNSKTETENKT